MKEPSLLSTAYRHGVPIFVGAVQDGSIFLNIVKLKRLLGDGVQARDRRQRRRLRDGGDAAPLPAPRKKKLAIWILGGGVPKNYTLQGEPLLDQILGVPTTASTSTCSSASTRSTTARSRAARRARGTPGARSRRRAWRPARLRARDVTAVFPWLTYALLLHRRRSGRPMRLMDRMSDAVAFLDRDVARRRTTLLASIDMEPGDRPAPSEAPSARWSAVSPDS